MPLTQGSFYILGDFDDDVLPDRSNFRKIIANTKLRHVITQATRITPDSATLLDVIVTSNLQSVIRSDYIPCPMADHEFITAKVSLKKSKPVPIFETFRDLRFIFVFVFSSDILWSLLKEEHNETDKY